MISYMKNILEITRTVFITAGVLSFFILTFVVKSDGLSGTQDLFGFAIPQPPQFTTFIPYFGYLIGIVFEIFSLHGLVTLAVVFSLIGIGLKIDKEINKLNEVKQSKKLSQEGRAKLGEYLKETGQISD